MQEDEILTVIEVAEYLKTTVKTVRELIKKGRLKAIKIGKGYRIRRKDLQALIEAK